MSQAPSPPPGRDETTEAPAPRSLRARLLLVLAGLLGALVVAEAALQVGGVEVRAGRLTRDPLLGWRNRPGWEGPVFSVNSLGFLGEEFSPTKPPGTVRVFCLGDSCTAGDLLASFDRTYPRQLEQELERRLPGARWQAINAGVGGYSSFQGRLWLEREILGYEPDALVLYFGWNDHWPARSGGPDKEVSGSLPERLRAGLSWCKLLQLGIKAYHMAREREPLPAAGPAGGTASQPDRPPRVSREDYAENLLAMVQAMGERGGETVIVTAPNYLAAVPLDSLPPGLHGGRDAVAALVELHDEYNAIARDVAREAGACLVDAARDFAEAADPEALFWNPPQDFIHLSAEGCRRLASAVARCPAFGKLANEVEQP
ncbi:MAG: SGNH/GDSL hydrolase family protein [Candidatus Brocadiia bacterium]